MAADLIARDIAATARDGALPALASLSQLSTRGIPPAADCVSAGTGQARALYVADGLATPALAASHPRFCKADAGGRYFRLAAVNGAITVEQGGATGTGNDQPAIQATIAYAIAAGIPEVRFGRARYELWTPARTSPIAFGLAVPDGIPLVVTGDVALIGAIGGTTLALKGPGGGARSQLLGDGRWLGGGLVYQGPGVTRSVLRNLKLDGGLTFANFYSLAEVDLSDKGVFFNDGIVPNLVSIDHRDCEFCNFAAEIWYMGGLFSAATVYVENLKLHHSPQSAWNPGSNAKVTAVNLEAGSSYQAAEVIAGRGHTYFGGRFYDWGQGGCSLIGGASQGGYVYTYGGRDAAAEPPWTTFVNTAFEGGGHGGQLSIGSWTRGSIRTTDCPVMLNAGVGHLRDIDLDIESWVDRNSNNSEAVSLNGPLAANVQVPETPPGTYYQKPSNISLRLRCRRTVQAQQNGLAHGYGLLHYGGLCDGAACRFVISGEAKSAFEIFGAPVSGFELPYIAVRDFRSLQYALGGAGVEATADTAYKVAWSAIAFYQDSSGCIGTKQITLDNAYVYAVGQRVRFFYASGGSDRILAFAKNGAGLQLAADRSLRRPGEYLDLEWTGARWAETAYVGQGA